MIFWDSFHCDFLILWCFLLHLFWMTRGKLIPEIYVSMKMSSASYHDIKYFNPEEGCPIFSHQQKNLTQFILEAWLYGRLKISKEETECVCIKKWDLLSSPLWKIMSTQTGDNKDQIWSYHDWKTLSAEKHRQKPSETL